MQTLELELDLSFIRHHPHRRQSMGIVGSELWIDDRCSRDQCLRTDQIGQVRGGLGGEYRVIRPTADLGTLDLAVPIGALHQPDHQPPVSRLCERCNACDDPRGSLLIRLHR